MESFSELIKTRRSMRKFTDEELTQEQVELLLRAALMSPSSHRSTGWQFIVVDDKAMLARLAESKASGSAFVAEAPLAIVVLGDPEVSDAWVEDASIAAIMIQLQAEDLGLGSCWAHMKNRNAADGTPADDIIHELLGIPDNLRVLCVIAVGHKGMERKPFNEEHLQWEKVHLNKW